MYRFEGHSVRGAKTLWCENHMTKIVFVRKPGEPPTYKCGRCGRVAKRV